MQISRVTRRKPNKAEEACERFIDYVKIAAMAYEKSVNENMIHYPSQVLHHFIRALDAYEKYVTLKQEQDKQDEEERLKAKWRNKFALCIEEMEWAAPLEEFQLIDKNESLYIRIFRNKFFRMTHDKTRDIPEVCWRCSKSVRNCRCYD